eukprot:7292754-Prymnesium_polylepis.1
MSKATRHMGSDGGGGTGEGGGGDGEGGGGTSGDGGEENRFPQSKQSVPKTHALYSEPGPPSSQSPSEA